MSTFWLYIGDFYYPTAAGIDNFHSVWSDKELAAARGMKDVTEGEWWVVVEVTASGPKAVARGSRDWDEEAERDE